MSQLGKLNMLQLLLAGTGLGFNLWSNAPGAGNVWLAGAFVIWAIKIATNPKDRP